MKEICSTNVVGLGRAQTDMPTPAATPIRAASVQRIFLASLFAVTLVLTPPVFSQIVTDGTVGPQVTLNDLQVEVGQSLGTLEGRNLFHSFSRFNVLPNGSVTFTGVGEIDNVISRVTGNEVSTIAGTLQSTIGNANFYFFNPEGIVLGGNATIDVPASLHLSTASGLSFSDGSIYSADSVQPSTLTMAVPRLFGFLPQAGNITIDNATLSLMSGGRVVLSGADIEITNSAANLQVDEFSLLAAGNGQRQLQLDQLQVDQLPVNSSEIAGVAGNLTLTGSSVDHSIKSSGDIYLQAGKIVIDSASLGGVAVGLDDQQISIVSNQLDLLNGGQIIGDRSSENGSVDIKVVTGDLLINGQESVRETGIYNPTATAQTGGDIDVIVRGMLQIVDGGEINTDSLAEGAGGDIIVAASELILDRMDDDRATGITSVARASGQGGNLDIDINGQLTIAGGAEIDASTSAAGDAGTVTLHAGEILLDGSDTRYSTGISAQVNENAAGNGGRLAVSADGSITIRERARVTVASFGGGDGGTVELSGDSLIVKDGVPDPATNQTGQTSLFTGVTGQTHGAGAGGNLSVNINGQLSAISAEGISSGSFGTGNAGDVTVSASDVLLDRQNSLVFTGISSGVAAQGDGGNISVTANNSLSIFGGAEITGSTFSSGGSGSVTVNAGDIVLDGSASAIYSTGISSQVNKPGSTGSGGNIVVSASGSVNIRSGARITVASFGSGDGGEIKLSSESLTLENPSENSGFLSSVLGETHGTGRGGTVTVATRGQLNLINGGLISSSSFGDGKAGDVVVSAPELVLDRMDGPNMTGIASAANAAGDGGNVSVSVTSASTSTTSGSLLIAGGAEITASTNASGNSGSVTVEAGNITLDGGASATSPTGISSQVNAMATGDGGNVVVTASGHVGIRDGARITAASRGTGDGGTIELTSNSLTLEGVSSNTDFLTSVNGQTFGPGLGGTVSVKTRGQLRLINGGVISSGSFSDGNAGDVIVKAANIVLDGMGKSNFTGIASGANGAGTLSNGGNVTVTADGNLLIAGGSEISGSTFSNGSSGDVIVKAEALLIDRMGADNDTGISSQANLDSAGDGGSIEVTASELQIARGGRITVASFGSGEGGVATIKADRLIIAGLEYEEFTGIRSETDQASAGVVNVIAPSVVLSNGHIISSTSDDIADGGDIALRSGVLVMDSGFVQANADSGTGGDIVINSDAVLAAGSTVMIGGVERIPLQFDGPNIVQAVAPTGVNGVVEINAPELDVAALLSGLESNYYNGNSLVQNPCAAFTSGTQSSLTELSVGGLPARNQYAATDPGLVGMQQNRLFAVDKPGTGGTGQTAVTSTSASTTTLRAQEFAKNELTQTEPEDNETGVTPGTLLRAKYQWSVVRSTPRRDGKVITSLRVGARVRMIEQVGDWYQVTLEKNGTAIEGFMHHSVLESDARVSVVSPVDLTTDQTRLTGQARSKGDALVMVSQVKYQWSVVRARPAIDGEVVASLRAGADVAVTGQVGVWYQITFSSKKSEIKGYMHRSVLSLPVEAHTAQISNNHGRIGCLVRASL